MEKTLIKRSHINRILARTEEFIRASGFALPPFAWWTPDDWRALAARPEEYAQYREVRDNMLGWDVTDFGSGDIDNVGLTLFTIRNGNYARPDAYPKPYAEKLLVVNGRQITPFHYHALKMEDIINRGDGELIITLYNATPDDRLADTPVTVHSDGREYQIPAGGQVRLGRGQSITLERRVFHQFQGADERMLLVGEVSCVNDDNADNIFLKPGQRFMEIEEDEPARRVLCNEYPT